MESYIVETTQYERRPRPYRIVKFGPEPKRFKKFVPRSKTIQPQYVL